MKKFSIACLLFSFVAVPVAPASAGCTANRTTGSIRSGSSITADTVVVCASSSKSTASTTVIKKVTSVAPAPAPVPCVIKLTTAIPMNNAGLTGCTFVLVAPVVAKPKVVIKPITAVSSSSLSDQASFTPNPVEITASSLSGAVGQSFFFSANAFDHTKAGIVLGKAAEVSFTPVTYDWNSGQSAGPAFASNWATSGSYRVSVTVTYLASYLIAGSSQWQRAGNVQSSASITVTVGDLPIVAVVAKRKPPLLVSGSCRPGAYGC